MDKDIFGIPRMLLALKELRNLKITQQGFNKKSNNKSSSNQIYKGKHGKQSKPRVPMEESKKLLSD